VNTIMNLQVDKMLRNFRVAARPAGSQEALNSMELVCWLVGCLSR
jgi:hypothetical protein